MVITSSSEKTQASCLRTENVTQKRTYPSFLFKCDFYIYKTGKIWSSLWKAEICSGQKYSFSLCKFFNLIVCSVFLVKLRLIIIIATLDGTVYFEKFYVTCIYIYIYLFYSMFIFTIFIQENVTSCPLCDLRPFTLKNHWGSRR